MATIHSAGFKGFRCIYFKLRRKSFFRSLLWPGIFTFITLPIYMFANKEKTCFDFLQLISELCVNIAPSILGFTITGYVLIMGMSNTKIIVEMKKEDNGEPSLFQCLNATFVIMLISIISALLAGIITTISLSANITLPIPKAIVNIYNWSCLFIITFIMYY